MDLSSLFANGIDVPSPPEEFDAKQLPSHGGVWLLADEQGRPIQLGGCENLRKSISFRFSAPDTDEKRRAKADVRSITRRIWWWPTHSQFETTYDYYRIARRLYPDCYQQMIAFGPSWFIRIDLEARVPRLAATERVFTDDAEYFGPFATRVLCNTYIELVQDLFNLCRHPDVLEKVPRGIRCAYYDMGKCSAPCDGTAPMDWYRGILAYAVQFLRTGPADYIAEAEREMKRLAAEQEFEKAAGMKRRIDQARKATASSYRFVCPAGRFRWLIVQRGTGRSQVKPFFVRGGCIERGEPVELKKLEDQAGKWMDVFKSSPPDAAVSDRRHLAEQTWLVSHFLFRSEKLPGLFLRADPPPDAETICAKVREAFRRPARKPGALSLNPSEVSSEAGEASPNVGASKDEIEDAPKVR